MPRRWMPTPVPGRQSCAWRNVSWMLRLNPQRAPGHDSPLVGEHPHRHGRGERFDGQDFVSNAAGAGAVAALVSRDWADAHRDAALPLLVVDEPVAALQRLAAWWRARLEDLLVVGITGSIGK